MIEIASMVFARLNETPVNSFGFTTQKHIDTEAPDTKSLLAASLWELNLGLPVGKSTASNITLSVVEDDFTVHASIQASVLSERAIFVFYQCLYQAPSAPSGYFDLGVLLKGRFERYRTDQERVIADVVAAVNARERKRKET
jgi:hypothetical protein